MIKMACRYQSYLVAASPPGFELLAYNKLHYNHQEIQIPDQINILQENKKASRFPKIKRSSQTNPLTNEQDKSNEYPFLDNRINNNRDQEKDQQKIIEWESAYMCLKPCCVNKNDDSENESRKKKIKFADENGGMLCSIKIANEPSDVPPNLCLKTILKSDEVSSITNNQEEFEARYVIKMINFNLHSNVDLNERMHSNLCLEHISCRGDMLVGRIITKNILSEKKVYLRYTTDEWKSVIDKNCIIESSSYVVNVYGYEYEMYTFDISLDNFKIPLEIQMAICYNVDGLEYWDNNNGDNYKFVLEELRTNTNTQNYELDSMIDNYSGTNFAPDCIFGNDLPYW